VVQLAPQAAEKAGFPERSAANTVIPVQQELDALQRWAFCPALPV